jgi:hypothetical protein
MVRVQNVGLLLLQPPIIGQRSSEVVPSEVESLTVRKSVLGNSGKPVTLETLSLTKFSKHVFQEQ